MSTLISGPCGFLASGDLPSWIEAIATTFAFVVALVIFMQSVSERRKSQARLISARLVYSRVKKPKGAKLEINNADDSKYLGFVDKIQGTVSEDKKYYVLDEDCLAFRWIINNESSEMLGATRVVLVDTDGVEKKAFTKLFFVPPRGIVDGTSVLKIADPPTGNLELKIQFQDSVGRYWERTPGKPLKKLRRRDRKKMVVLRESGTWEPFDPDLPNLHKFVRDDGV